MEEIQHSCIWDSMNYLTFLELNLTIAIQINECVPVHTFFEIKLPVLEIKVLVNKCLKVTFMAGKTEKNEVF